MRKKKVSQREYIRRQSQSKKACGVTLHLPEPQHDTSTRIEMTPTKVRGTHGYAINELDTSTWQH